MEKTKRKKVVSSKIELTKPKVDKRSLSLQRYHTSVNQMADKIEKFVLELSADNLLSVKMALMQTVSRVERRIKKNMGRG